MFTDIFQQIGLSKNESQIYETLLREGELAVGALAEKSKVHRRNVYDAIKRMMGKGLVFEIVSSRENRYQAVAPQKLMETIEEKREKLAKVLPQLEKLYAGVPHTDDVFIYRGIEGCKNYMRDILRLGQDVYSIGAKGGWTDPRLKGFLQSFLSSVKKQKITMHVLVDDEARGDGFIKQLAVEDHRFLPKECSTFVTMDIFGDRVVIFSDITLGKLDEDISFTVIVNQQIADAFRAWFQFIWQQSVEEKKKKT